MCFTLSQESYELKAKLAKMGYISDDDFDESDSDSDSDSDDDSDYSTKKY